MANNLIYQPRGLVQGRLRRCPKNEKTHLGAVRRKNKSNPTLRKKTEVIEKVLLQVGKRYH